MLVRNTLSNYIANAVYVEPRRRYSFKGRPWAPALFDTPSPKKLWKMSRQVGKSTGLASDGAARCCTEDNFRILYVAPEMDQTRKFSHDKLKPIIEESPIILAHKGDPQNVFERGFIRPNGSRGVIYLKYAKTNPDPCRGLTVDMTKYDEIQDMDLDRIEPVIRESMFTSEYGYTTWAGTPKSLINPVENKWRESDQREWLIRCDHHTPAKWIRLGIRNIGKLGPSCHHCGNLLNIDNGAWVKHNAAGKFAGFHVNQMHCKSSHATQHKWNELLEKYETTERSLFLNEVMGDSSDTAEVPITESLIKKLCDPDYKMISPPPPERMKYYNFAGIDWGHGKFTTSLAIGQIDQEHGVFRIIYFKMYQGKECSPRFCLPDIVSILQKFQVVRVHCDHGGGFGLNDGLDVEMARVGKKGIVTSNYWSDSATSRDARWSSGQEIPRLTMNKTNALTKFISKLESGKVMFPRWKDTAAVSEHFLNIRKEVNEKDGTFNYGRAGFDDMFHACVYSDIIARAYFAAGI